MLYYVRMPHALPRVKVGLTLQIRSDACLHGNVHVNNMVVSLKPPSFDL